MCVAVGVYHDTERFDAGRRQLAFDRALLQHLLDAVAWLDVDDRFASNLPFDAVRFQKVWHDALVSASFDQ